MTRVFDDPATFKDDVIAGFTVAYSRYVDRVPGASGFVRRGGPRVGKVSLVVGGGSGHYPSYAGIVGSGLADGCVLGDVFTSPSAEQVYRVARAADGRAGVVLAFGNYAGDRLNFAAARERLLAEGTDTRIVYVTDDIASAPSDERDLRRGIAGTAVVYKVGGAAADSGYDLDGVERVMRAANAATFSYGVAFAGCTLPGQNRPLFTVEDGQMEFGLGIHGEPGVRSAPSMPARALAAGLVEAVLAERPPAVSGRAAVILNGLGATKYEELFLLYGQVYRLLADAGVVAVLPEVGELVTSLDMAGCSLSVTWLDDELEAHWCAPVDTAAFRRGGPPLTTSSGSLREAGFSSLSDVSLRDVSLRDVSVREASVDDASVDDASVHDASVHDASVDDASVREATPEARRAAATVRRALAAMLEAAVEAEERLGQLDAIAGDGDHGTAMTRGLRAACAAADAVDGDAGSTLRAAGDAFGDRAGGTSGILWGILLGAVGMSLGDTDEVTAERLSEAVRHGTETIQRVGKAEPGDKTMLDALFPFVDDLESRLGQGSSLADAWAGAARAAVAAAASTASLVPKVGRARPLAKRSVGTPDPGATSMGIVLTAVGRVLGEDRT